MVAAFGRVGLNLTLPADYPESWAWGATAAGGGTRERPKGENKEIRERAPSSAPKRLCFREGLSNPTPATILNVHSGLNRYEHSFVYLRQISATKKLVRKNGILLLPFFALLYDDFCKE